jgi:hypothetical protein
MGDDAMKRLVTAALVVAIAGLAGVARAEDKNSPTGTWNWTVERNNQKFDQTLKLKLEGDALTGAMVRNGQETKIEDGKYKDGKISFTVTRERNGQKFTVKYKGKVTGDTINGKTEREVNGQTQSGDWKAKRSKA